MTVAGQTHRRLSFEVKNVGNISRHQRKKFQEFTDNYSEEDIYVREMLSKRNAERV